MRLAVGKVNPHRSYPYPRRGKLRWGACARGRLYPNPLPVPLASCAPPPGKLAATPPPPYDTASRPQNNGPRPYARDRAALPLILDAVAKVLAPVLSLPSSIGDPDPILQIARQTGAGLKAARGCDLKSPPPWLPIDHPAHPHIIVALIIGVRRPHRRCHHERQAMAGSQSFIALSLIAKGLPQRSLPFRHRRPEQISSETASETLPCQPEPFRSHPASTPGEVWPPHPSSGAAVAPSSPFR